MRDNAAALSSLGLGCRVQVLGFRVQGLGWGVGGVLGSRLPAPLPELFTEPKTFEAHASCEGDIPWYYVTFIFKYAAWYVYAMYDRMLARYDVVSLKPDFLEGYHP